MLSNEVSSWAFSLGKYNCQKVLPETLICCTTKRNTAKSLQPPEKGKSLLVNRIQMKECRVELRCVEFTCIDVSFPKSNSCQVRKMGIVIGTAATSHFWHLANKVCAQNFIYYPENIIHKSMKLTRNQFENHFAISNHKVLALKCHRIPKRSTGFSFWMHCILMALQTFACRWPKMQCELHRTLLAPPPHSTANRVLLSNEIVSKRPATRVVFLYVALPAGAQVRSKKSGQLLTAYVSSYKLCKKAKVADGTRKPCTCHSPLATCHRL